jgi:hypothetical protein
VSSAQQSSRAKEDELFVFVAAFKRVPASVDDWGQLFRQVFADILSAHKRDNRAFIHNWRVRLSYSAFVAEFVASLSKFREEHQVAFALKNVSELEIIHTPTAKLPAAFERATSECIDAYFSNYIIVAGAGFLRRRFRAVRGMWLREMFFKFLPFAALIITVAISLLAMNAMRKSSVGTSTSTSTSSSTSSGTGATGVLGGVDVATFSAQAWAFSIAQRDVGNF